MVVSEADTERFRCAPMAKASTREARVIWPVSGVPAAFGDAAAALYDCFGEPLAVNELAEDMRAAVGLTEAEAVTSAFAFVNALLSSGHLIREGLDPMPVSLLSYPPSASP